eukprot:PhM_4_TR10608/c0_g1_i2/m.32646
MKKGKVVWTRPERKVPQDPLTSEQKCYKALLRGDLTEVSELQAKAKELPQCRLVRLPRLRNEAGDLQRRWDVGAARASSVQPLQTRVRGMQTLLHSDLSAYHVFNNGFVPDDLLPARTPQPKSDDDKHSASNTHAATTTRCTTAPLSKSSLIDANRDDGVVIRLFPSADPTPPLDSHTVLTPTRSVASPRPFTATTSTAIQSTLHKDDDSTVIISSRAATPAPFSKRTPSTWQFDDHAEDLRRRELQAQRLAKEEERRTKAEAEREKALAALQLQHQIKQQRRATRVYELDELRRAEQNEKMRLQMERQTLAAEVRTQNITSKRDKAKEAERRTSKDTSHGHNSTISTRKDSKVIEEPSSSGERKTSSVHSTTRKDSKVTEEPSS